MLNWFLTNAATIIVCVIVIAVLALVLGVMIRNKKLGKSSCSCGGSCGTCGAACSCHNSK